MSLRIYGYTYEQFCKLSEKKRPPLRAQSGPGIGLAYRLSRLFPEWIGNSFMNRLARRVFRRALP